MKLTEIGPHSPDLINPESNGNPYDSDLELIIFLINSLSNRANKICDVQILDNESLIYVGTPMKK